MKILCNRQDGPKDRALRGIYQVTKTNNKLYWSYYPNTENNIKKLRTVVPTLFFPRPLDNDINFMEFNAEEYSKAQILFPKE